MKRIRLLIITNILLLLLFNSLPVENEASLIKEDITTIQEINEIAITSRSLNNSRCDVTDMDVGRIKEITEVSQNGIAFIKQKEGFIEVAKRLKGEQYMTIGYRTLWSRC